VAESTLAITLADLRNEVARFQGYMQWDSAGSSTNYDALTAAQQAEVTAIIASGLRQFYAPPPLPGERTAHVWSFLRRVRAIAIPAPVAMGSSNAVSTCVSGLVSLSGATNIPSWVASGVAQFGSAGKFWSVSTRVGDHSFQLDDTDADSLIEAGDTVTFYQCIFDLPDDFGGIDGNVTFDAGRRKGFVQQTNEARIRMLASNSTAVRAPEVYAVRPRSWPDGSATGTRHEMLVWPWPDQAYVVEYPYKVLPNKLGSATYVPLGGAQHGEAIRCSCLAVAEQYAVTERTDYRTRQWPAALAASVLRDRQDMGANLGYNRDLSGDDGVRWSLRRWDETTITTVNGVEP